MGRYSFKNYTKMIENYVLTCVKSDQIGVVSGPYISIFGLNTGKYGPEKTLYLQRTFHAV